MALKLKRSSKRLFYKERLILNDKEMILPTNSLEKKLNVSNIQKLRYIKGVTRLDMIRNEEIRKIFRFEEGEKMYEKKSEMVGPCFKERKR